MNSRKRGLFIACHHTTSRAWAIVRGCIVHVAASVILVAAMLSISAGMGQAGQLNAVGIRFEDLPPALAKRFDRVTFPGLIRDLSRETLRRKRDGEFDHLIAYALQSRQFTNAPRIEPAVSAKAFAQSALVPPGVRLRLREFLHALSNPAGNPRLEYFSHLVPAHDRNLKFLEGEYRRVVSFLYAKEFLHEKHAYETRGYSTDTQVAANYVIWNALSVLKATNPDLRVRRVLLIGPGMDLAPRTALIDAVPPQSFQPYLVADALLTLGLSVMPDLEIDCVDINERVVGFINSFSKGQGRLELYSAPGTDDYNRYFRSLGTKIGSLAPATPAGMPGDLLTRAINVEPSVARAVHASELNISTQRLAGTYDLAIATNVLLYFESPDLALALCNTAAMLGTGAYFIHNDLRPETEADAKLVGFEMLQARSVLVAEGRRAPLYDTFALNRKR
jgi:hypothetical protein